MDGQGVARDGSTASIGVGLGKLSRLFTARRVAQGTTDTTTKEDDLRPADATDGDASQKDTHEGLQHDKWNASVDDKKRARRISIF
jgi:hypothetical protein